MKARLSLDRSPLTEITGQETPVEASSFFVSHGSFGIVDLGASQTVIGEHQVNEVIQQLPKSTPVREVSCSTAFRFGNSSTVKCDRALLVPLGPYYVKICIVPSKTPFLLSNNMFRKLEASIHTASDEIFFGRLNLRLPLQLTEKKLYLLDFAELVRLAQKDSSSQARGSTQVCPDSILSVSEIPGSRSQDQVSENQPSCTTTEQSDSCPSHPDPSSEPDRHVQQQGNIPVRSLQGPAHGCDRRTAGSGSDDNRRIVHDEDHIRGGQARPNLSRGAADRSQVCQLVSQSLPGQFQTSPQGFRELSSEVHRGGGDQPGSDHGRPSGHIDQGISQGKSKLSFAPCIDRGECGVAERRDVGRGGRRSRESSPRFDHRASKSPTRSTGKHVASHTPGADAKQSQAGSTGSGHHTERDQVRAVTEPESPLKVPSEVRSMLMDCTGCDTYQDNPEEVIDQAYFQDLQVTVTNPIYQEMCQYFGKHYGTPEAIDSHLSKIGIDLLEVYCDTESQLTSQTQELGLKAVRFCRHNGDLGTFGGRCKLYDLIWVTRPRNIWTSPTCGPWSGWSHLNAGKSLILAERIIRARSHERCHLHLCDALCRMQIRRRSDCHFHLEQPVNSDMLFQGELSFIVHYTLQAKFDMCTGGNLRHPEHGDTFLKKHMQIWTTSRVLHRTIEQWQCLGHHKHMPIAGSCQVPGRGRMPVTKYTEMYTRGFARRIGQVIGLIAKNHEEQAIAQGLDDILVGEDTLHREVKRRRIETKSPPEPSSAPDAHARVAEILQEADHVTPRVGRNWITQGKIIDKLQQLFPEKQIIAVDACRGINRLRIPPKNVPPQSCPFRRAVGRKRTDQTTMVDEDWENWTVLSNRQQIRAGTPTRLLLTMFAAEHSLNQKSVSQPYEPDHFGPDQGEMPPTLNPETADRNAEQEPPESEPEKSRVLKPVHGPLFRALPDKVQNQIIKIHKNLGHPGLPQLRAALQSEGWSDVIIRALPDFVCDTCREQEAPKIARPAHLTAPKDFNDLVSFDALEWKTTEGKSFWCYHFIDSATNFHTAIPYQQGTSQSLMRCFEDAWIRWAGPPKEVMFDSCGEANSQEFGEFLQSHDIKAYPIPSRAHWQLGRAERNGAILKTMLSKYHAEQSIIDHEGFRQALLHLCCAKNTLSKHAGYSPELLVLGKSRRVPGSLMENDPQDASSFLDTEGSHFRHQMMLREAARIAYVKADHCSVLRKSLHARSRPFRMNHQIGDWVMYWKSSRTEEGRWLGPARVLMVEHNAIWLSHLTRLYRVAPEHVRVLSSHEQLLARELKELGTTPIQGAGVFQYQDQIQEIPSEIPRGSRDARPSEESPPEIIPGNPGEVPRGSRPNSIGSEQPDTEPEISSTRPASPTIGDSPMPDAAQVPVPEDDDDSLVVTNMVHDHWQVVGNKLIRHHVNPRMRYFHPTDDPSCPIPVEALEGHRLTLGKTQHGKPVHHQDVWKDSVVSHGCVSSVWTGKTVFQVDPLKGKDLQTRAPTPPIEDSKPTGVECEIMLTTAEINRCRKVNQKQQIALIASAAKRQKIEVRMRDLSASERKEFEQAKEKELNQWISTETIRRILRSQVPEHQILRTRWILTWKPLDEQTVQETGKQRKAKARLVVLGYEDPDLDSVQRDSPTLGRDSRMLALQMIASQRWSLRSFDIATAFLRGSKQDDRILAIEPPEELRQKLGLKSNETCELLKGAYGLVNAPLLWYAELRKALLGLDFLVSPLDPCLFILPKKTHERQSHDPCQIHGVLGIHVDDGICGGDAIFEKAIDALERKYPFGSKKTQKFVFTGIQVNQEASGDITLNQTEYVKNIPPIDIPRERRKETKTLATKEEIQGLRGLIGSLQYAATNTRPDVSCRLSLLQAKIPNAVIGDLLEANRLLDDTKRHADVQI